MSVSKVKEVKVREKNGNYSDPVPIGADAVNIDYRDSDVKTELDKLNDENNDRKNSIDNLVAQDDNLQEQINTNKDNIELQASRVDALKDTLTWGELP